MITPESRKPWAGIASSYIYAAPLGVDGPIWRVDRTDQLLCEILAYIEDLGSRLAHIEAQLDIRDDGQ